ncbi:MAG: hypothetical protein AB7O67_19615 [Vicinamibacterales bacterium]
MSRTYAANVRWSAAGLLAILSCGVAYAATGEATGNLIPDPGFEAGISDFYAQDGNGAVLRIADAPIAGTASLRATTTGWGTNLWWSYDFSGGRASRLQVGAHLRSEQPSGSTLQFCAMVYFEDGDTDVACTPVDGSAGDKGLVSADLAIDPARPLTWVNVRMIQEGGDPLSFLVDDAFASLDVVQAPEGGGTGGGDGDSGGDEGNGGDGGGGEDGGSTSGGDACTTSGAGVYPGFTYELPQARPYISLDAFTQSSPTAPARQRLIGAADAAIAGDPAWAYSAVHSVLAYTLTGTPIYLDDAIARVEAFVTGAESAIAAGQAPDIAYDSYLDVGWYLEQLALVYDRGYAQLTPAQRARWEAIAEQALQNVWHPAQASWGGVAHPWSGWSICDPGNNYHFSFLRATMLWALASQNPEWLAFLQTEKFGPLLDYYAALDGGGTREGTGYGTALNGLFGNYLYWKASTGEDLASITPHARETIDYWIHATVPTLDRFAPIADLSRSSIPEIYDYQENLVHQAVVLSAGTPEARRGTWWLQHNSVDGVAHVFNIAGDLLPYPDQAEAPTALMYYAPGAGALFARTSWQPDAAWMAFVAGRFDQSHAHEDQGSFTFFKGDWLAVTNNIWSHSGIHQEVDVHNVLRFERADGSVIGQNRSDTVASSMTPGEAGGVTTVAADLSNAYSASTSLVHGWTRNLTLAGDTLRVTDACSVADGVRVVFQLQVPEAPELLEDGSIRAGHLLVVPLAPVDATFVAMETPEFQRGYRIELTTDAGCTFDVELRAVTPAQP